jgi:hypothetical protein
MMTGGLATASHATGEQPYPAPPCTSWGFACAASGYTGTNLNFDGEHDQYDWVENYYGLNWGVAPDGHNCTRYVAFRLAQNGYGDPGDGFGDASQWDTRVPASTVTHDPAVGSIAQWNGGSGHVSYVEAVAPDGSWIDTTEDNYFSNTTASERIYKNDVNAWPDNFLHLGAPFAVSTDPVIGGVRKVGEILSVVPANYSPAPETLTYQWYRGNSPIGGETGPTYQLTQADLEQDIKVVEVAMKPTYTRTVKASAAVHVEQDFFDIFIPHMTGTAHLDSMLTATLETNTPDVDLEYQWKRNGVAIENATWPWYSLGVDDVGTDISVTIKGSKDGYFPITQTTAAKTVTADHFEGMAMAFTSGTPQIGQVLTAILVSDETNVRPQWQWRRNGVPIPGATEETYAPTDDDYNKGLSVTITLTKPGFVPLSVTSIQTNPVIGAEVPFDIFIPHMSGTAKVDSVLTASLQTNTPDVSLAWRWNRDGVPIPGAIAQTYTLKQADIGTSISVTITGTKPGYETTTQTSSAATVTADTFQFSGAPASIGGTAKVEYTLSAGSAISTTGSSYSITWLRNGSHRQTGGTTLALTSADIGSTIQVQYTYSKPGYKTQTYTSPGVGIAGYSTYSFNGAPAALSGTAKVEFTLTASSGIATTGVSTSIQWFKNGVLRQSGGNTMLLAASDIGSTITVRYTYDKQGYATTTYTSPGVVVAGYSSFSFSGAPATISGTAKSGYTLTANSGLQTSGVTVTYQWYRNGVAVSGRTARTYALTSTDKGAKITVRIYFDKQGYQATSSLSPAVTIAS